MTQHPERWNIGELHVRKVKETITGGCVTPRDKPIELKWVNHCAYIIDNQNPLGHTYDKQPEQLELIKTKKHQNMSRMSYGNDDINDDLPF